MFLKKKWPLFPKPRWLTCAKNVRHFPNDKQLPGTCGFSKWGKVSCVSTSHDRPKIK